MSKICKKRVYGNEKMDLPYAFLDCARSLHFTLLVCSLKLHLFSCYSFDDCLILDERLFHFCQHSIKQILHWSNEIIAWLLHINWWKIFYVSCFITFEDAWFFHLLTTNIIMSCVTWTTANVLLFCFLFPYYFVV